MYKLNDNDNNWFKKIDQLRSIYHNFPMALDEMPGFILWCKANKDYLSSWDKHKLEFCKDAIGLGMLKPL